jgi:hypothetical protein
MERWPERLGGNAATADVRKKYDDTTPTGLLMEELARQNPSILLESGEL